MSKLTELLVNAMAPTVGVVVEDAVSNVLEKLAEKNPEAHKSTVQGLAIGLRHLKSLTDSTKTKIDDAAVDGLLGAVEDSALKHGIELPE